LSPSINVPATAAVFSIRASRRPARQRRDGVEVVKTNCTVCHAADYVQTQPRGAKFKKDFWQAEVTKMIKVYGASIEDADVGKIVEYLTATY
jgi:cytochrome c5